MSIIVVDSLTSLTQRGFPTAMAYNMLEKAEFAYARDYLPGTDGYRRFADENAQLQRIHPRAFLVKAPERGKIPQHLEVWTLLGEGPITEGPQPPVGSRRHMLIDHKTGEPREFGRHVLEELWRDDFSQVSGAERVREVEAWMAAERRERTHREAAVLESTKDDIARALEMPERGPTVPVEARVERMDRDAVDRIASHVAESRRSRGKPSAPSAQRE